MVKEGALTVRYTVDVTTPIGVGDNDDLPIEEEVTSGLVKLWEMAVNELRRQTNEGEEVTPFIFELIEATEIRYEDVNGDLIIR